MSTTRKDPLQSLQPSSLLFTHAVQVKLSPDLHAFLRALATRRGLPMGTILRILLEDHQRALGGPDPRQVRLDEYERAKLQRRPRGRS